MTQTNLKRDLHLRRESAQHLVGRKVNATQRHLHCLFCINIHRKHHLNGRRHKLHTFLNTQGDLLSQGIRYIFQLHRLRIGNSNRIQHALRRIHQYGIGTEYRIRKIILTSGTQRAAQLHRHQFGGSRRIDVLQCIRLHGKQAGRSIQLVQHFLFKLRGIYPYLIIHTRIIGIIENNRIEALSQHIVEQYRSLILYLDAEF